MMCEHEGREHRTGPCWECRRQSLTDATIAGTSAQPGFVPGGVVTTSATGFAVGGLVSGPLISGEGIDCLIPRTRPDMPQVWDGDDS